MPQFMKIIIPESDPAFKYDASTEACKGATPIVNTPEVNNRFPTDHCRPLIRRQCSS